MRVDTSMYTPSRPRGLGCWMFEFIHADGTSAGLFTSKYRKYGEAAAEARLIGRSRVGRRGKAVLCP
jgi:hypothetical protein